MENKLLDDTGKHPLELKLISFGKEGFFQPNVSHQIKQWWMDHIITYGYSPNKTIHIIELSKKILKEKDDNKRKKLKSELPFVIPSGLCSGKICDTNMKIPSGMIGIDIDIKDNPEWFSSGEKINELIESLKKNKYVFRVWRSPSGGLKVLILIPDSFETFRASFYALEEYFKVSFNVVIDSNCRNPSRKLSLCHSPFLYKNNDSEVFQELLHKEEEHVQLTNKSITYSQGSEEYLQVLNCIEQIEQRKIDITDGYENWLRIGFSLSYFGEDGRELFHRASMNYPKYSRKECDEQFNHVLKKNNGKITLATFFYYCNQNNIKYKKMKQTKNNTSSSIDSQKNGENRIYGKTPIIPDIVYMYLPEPLNSACRNFGSSRQRDMFLIGSLSILSGCMPNVLGLYDQRYITTNIYAAIGAPSAAGKGVINWAIMLARSIQERLKKEYQEDLKRYEAAKKEDTDAGEKPTKKILLFPGNNSSSGLIQLLSTNKRGIIAETESDTISSAWGNKEWGNYSDTLRGVYENEGVKLYRKTDQEFIEVYDVYLSVLFTGTPKSLANLFFSSENGIYSRFNFYVFEETDPFRNPFDSYQSLEVPFRKYSEMVERMYFELLNKEEKIIFSFTQEQKDKFYHLYKDTVDNGAEYYGPNSTHILKRAAAIHFKLCMILTILRNGHHDEYCICDVVDFELATMLMAVFKEHSFAMLNTLPEKDGKDLTRDIREGFLNRLPKEFATKEAIEIGRELKISHRTVNRYLKDYVDKGLLVQPKQGAYFKESLN